MLPETISDDEIIYRRIPVSVELFSPETGLSPQAFHPDKRDISGISFTRALSRTPEEEAASGENPKGYFIARLRVSSIRAAGLDVGPSPTEENPGHCEISTMNADSRRKPACRENELILKTKCLVDVLGPLDSVKS